jgi:hypothetical protein
MVRQKQALLSKRKMTFCFSTIMVTQGFSTLMLEVEPGQEVTEPINP